MLAKSVVFRNGVLGCVLGTGLALATMPVNVRAAEAHTQATYQFNLPQQALGDALRAIGQQTMTNILFDPRSVMNRMSPALHATLTARQAIQEVLRGTNLSASRTPDDAILVQETGAGAGAPGSTGALLPAGEFRLAQSDVPTGQAPEESDSERSKPAESSETSASSELSTIVVTARKRTELLQNVPEAITALTEQRLRELNADTIDDYVASVPGLNIETTTFTGSGREFSIRGINHVFFGAPPTAATVSQYLDETPTSATVASVDFRVADIERVEVLRGPQGTLYGEGAMGGTIRVITKKPHTRGTEGYIEGKLSNTQGGQNNYSASGALNLPLINDQLALRFTGYHAFDGGYVDNIQTGAKNTNDVKVSGGRAAALWTPSIATSILTQYIYQSSDRGFGGLWTPKLGDLKYSAGGDTGNEQLTGKIWNITAQQDFADIRFVSTTSYSESTSNSYQLYPPEHSSYVPGGAAFEDVDLLQHGVVEEMRLGSLDSGPFSWIGGLFYNNRKQHRLQTSMGNVCRTPPPLPGLPPPPLPPGCESGPALGITSGSDIRQKRVEKAIFGETGYSWTSAFTTTFGLRWASSEVSADTIGIHDNAPGLRITNVEYASASSNAVTGKFNASYRFGDGRLVFLQVSRGFRGGGFNRETEERNFSPPIDIPAQYAPDYTWNYELGLKWQGDRYRFSTSVFRIDWQGMQVFISQPLYPGDPYSPRPEWIVNAGKAATEGVELEAGYSVSRTFDVGLTATMLDARLREDMPNATITHSAGFKGDRIPWTYKFQGSVFANYRRPLVNHLDLTLNATYQFLGKSQTSFNDDSRSSEPGNYYVIDPRHTVGAQIGVDGRGWSARLFVDNAFNRRNVFLKVPHSRAGFDDPTDVDVISNTPRTVGLTLRKEF